MTQLKLYGENAFTFLFFNEISGDEGKLKKLLENLKRFDKPTSKFPTATLDLNEPEIWLFPSFGKRWGFGEPDALLLVGEHVFWFEVETMFVLDRSEQSTARDTLRQLYRFHCAARAFAKGQITTPEGRAIEGPTITNEDQRKPARLALRGHEAASKLRDRLETACASGRSHYVLLPVRQPRGGADGFHTALEMIAPTAFSYWDSILEWSDDVDHLEIDHCWYTYWHGDLKRFFNENDLLAGYVPIKKGS